MLIWRQYHAVKWCAND